MESFLQLVNEWEIRMLVLLSFMLQLFLFFTGSLQQRGVKILSVAIWIAYLVADLVAVYAHGLLSKRGNHPLAFFWAPFLLIHLGGQDTITAFSLEDNSLWLRHLLNLIVQVGLALYVFWKSTACRNAQHLVSGIFLFVAGVIKYGERTMALMYGNLQNISTAGCDTNEENKSNHPALEDASYSSIIRFSLDSAPIVRHLFAGFTTFQIPEGFRATTWTSYAVSDEFQLAKLWPSWLVWNLVSCTVMSIPRLQCCGQGAALYFDAHLKHQLCLPLCCSQSATNRDTTEPTLQSPTRCFSEAFS